MVFLSAGLQAGQDRGQGRIRGEDQEASEEAHDGEAHLLRGGGRFGFGVREFVFAERTRPGQSEVADAGAFRPGQGQSGGELLEGGDVGVAA